jgi:hypothetical protein
MQPFGSSQPVKQKAPPLRFSMRSLKLSCIRDGHSVDVAADPSHGWDDFQKLLKKKFGMSVWLKYMNRQKETVAVCDSTSYREFLAFCRLRALKDGVEEVRRRKSSASRCII